MEPDAEYFAGEVTNRTPEEVKTMYIALAQAPLRRQEPIGDLLVPSGVLLVGDMWSDYTASSEQAKEMMDSPHDSAAAVVVGDDDNGFLISVKPGRYVLIPDTHRLPWKPEAPKYEHIGTMHLVPT